ncbi:MAG: retroviral-like aspartic protease family protein [Burkholderiaceae bacterium]|nr:retroviral-like aspartic protease family protein [Roseateles sp.]MBV8470395.1 retroviral-like aspartic protease family protein [Burkholderiaceae bacterium]
MLGRVAIVSLGLWLGAGALAQTEPMVSLNGSMGQRAALLLIDGQPRSVAVGETVLGVKLLSVGDGQARVEINGRQHQLELGASQANVGAPALNGSAGQQIVLQVGSGGHVLANGSINGRSTQLMVDTGASTVALSEAEAQRIGLRYKDGRAIRSQTANGDAQGRMVTLDSIRIGDVEVHNVQGVVLSSPMPYVLLGNSFLERFQMRRSNDRMVLDLRQP